MGYKRIDINVRSLNYSQKYELFALRIKNDCPIKNEYYKM